MNILLFGANGQLGTELQQLWPADHLVSLRRENCDLGNPEAIRSTIRRIAPALIVNAAAYTAVDRAESEPEQCFAVNATAPAIMAEEAARAAALLVHYSTDYVFDGTKAAPYSENDATNPLNQYGKSKLEGERAIQCSGARYLILRTTWIFSPQGVNFVKTMLRLGRERQNLRVVCDQVGAPTSAKAIAEATFRALEHRNPTGLYHLTAGGEVSWAEFAKEIFRQAGWQQPPTVDAITTDEYPTPAKRPKNSRLSNEKFVQTFGFALPHWREQLRETLDALRTEASNK